MHSCLVVNIFKILSLALYSAQRRWNILISDKQRQKFFLVDWFKNLVGANWVFCELFFWPDGSLLKAATAIGTNVVKNMLNAIVAKRAFKTTDLRFQTVVGKKFTAIFTGRSNFKHNV
jgi:hypothetical protein